jgi:hypothetical protein
MRDQIQEQHTLYVKNENQVALFEHEVKGQISDGAWENSTPNKHWVQWCHTTAKVEEGKYGRNFHPIKCNYDLSGRLMPQLTQRMRLYVALSNITSDVERLTGFFDIDGNYRGMPETGKGKYWEEKRQELAGYDPKVIYYLVEDQLSRYQEKDLRYDLKELSKAMKTPLCENIP